MSANPSEENNKAVFWLPAVGVIWLIGLEKTELSADVWVNPHSDILEMEIIQKSGTVAQLRNNSITLYAYLEIA